MLIYSYFYVVKFKRIKKKVANDKHNDNYFKTLFVIILFQSIGKLYNLSGFAVPLRRSASKQSFHLHRDKLPREQ